MKRTAWIALLGLTFIANQASALPIFDNLGAGDTFASSGSLFFGQGHTSGTTLANIAQSFVASLTDDLASVEIPLLLLSGGPAMLTVHLATDAPGAPGSILQSSNITAPSGAASLATATFGAGTTLNAGSTYWVWLFAPGDAEISWQSTNPAIAGDYSKSFDYGQSWTPLGNSDLALRVNGMSATSGLTPNPEPTTLVLMGLGLLGLGLIRHKKNR